jgi:hypothetical protein
MLGVLNRGSLRLKLNEQARELFWFSLERRVDITVEWVPREKNSLADELSKLVIPDDKMLQKSLFRQMEQRWGGIRWTSSRPTRTTSARGSFRYTGAGGWQGLMSSRFSRESDRFGLAVLTDCWAEWGGC